MTRTLYGIGAGPGDPELITLLGLRRLREAGCVFLPATRPGASYVREIVSAYLEPERRPVIELVCPAYRDRATLQRRWLELARVVQEQLPEDGSGAFVCEGDPSLYSTFSYLRAALTELDSTLEIATVPGVDSVVASAALANVPLATWNERLLVTSAPREPDAIAGLLEQAETLAILKAAGPLTPIAEAIERLGSGMRAAAVQRAGRPQQAIAAGTEAMRTLPADYFTTILIRRQAP